MANPLGLPLWVLQTCVGQPEKPDEYEPADLARGLVLPAGRYVPLPDGAVQMRAYVEDVTSKGSEYPRVEFRELDATGNRAAWSTAGVTSLTARLAVTAAPKGKPEVVFAQVHGGGGKSDLFQALYSRGKIRVRINGSMTDDVIDHDYRLGTPFNLCVSVQAGALAVYYNGHRRAVGKIAGRECYWKLGAYVQSNTKHDTAGEYGEIVLHLADVKHGAELPAAPQPPPVVGAPALVDWRARAEESYGKGVAELSAGQTGRAVAHFAATQAAAAISALGGNNADA